MTNQIPNFTPGQPPQTIAALGKRNVQRTLLILTGLVLVLGGALYWMQWRTNRISTQRIERTRQHVILRPGDEAQDWRAKEGSRVEELAKVIQAQAQQVKDVQAQLDQLRTQQRRDTEAVKTGRRGGPGGAPPVPPAEGQAPLDQILPPPGAAFGTPSVQIKPAPTAQAPTTVTQKPKASAPPATTAEGTPAEPGTSHITVPATPKKFSSPQSTKPAPAAQGPTAASTIPKLRVITQRAVAKGGTVKETLGWLPSGSFIHSVLLSGVDAGTGTGSNMPYPVLLRLNDPGVLPNRFKMDLAECFVIGAAFGDLPSERVYIRSESLSCLRRSGGIMTIDGDLKGHAIGEDGKLGLRGRVVSKEGTLIARTLLAGFLSGIGQTFRPNITYAPAVLGGSSPIGAQPFSLPPVDETLEAAAVSGVGRSMDMLARYYLRQAQNLYPIIEINAGREVDIVVLKGLALKFNIQRAAATEADRLETIE